MARAKNIILAICLLSITITSVFCFGDYVYPFERKLDPVLVAEFDLGEEYVLKYPGQKFWHGAYEAYGLWQESQYFNPTNYKERYGVPWPPLDFQTNCYIVTYGQEIESLSYNVWDIMDVPYITGAKVGHMILSDEFYPEKVFIYRIPKVRIENDVNDVHSPWD